MAQTTKNTQFKIVADNCTQENLPNKEPQKGALVEVDGVLKMGNGSAFTDVASGGGDFLDKVTTNPQTVAGPVEFLEDITVPTGSVILGKDGARISSAARSLGFTDARERTNLAVHYERGDNSTFRPYYWEFGASQTANVTPTTGTTLSGDMEFAFPGVGGDVMTIAFSIIPLSTGTLRVQSWEGSDDTGAVLVDNTFEVGVARLNSVMELQIPSPIITEFGDSQFTRFSGVDLDGGVQASGEFAGQTLPYLDSTFQILTRQNIANVGDISGGGVQTVSGDAVDNTDPANPFIEERVEKVSGGFLIVVDNSDQQNPVVRFGLFGTTQNTFQSFIPLMATNGTMFPSSRSGVSVLPYTDFADGEATFEGLLPNGYDGEDVFIDIDWTSATATSGNVVFGVEIKRLAPSSNIDVATFASVQTETDGAPATAGVIKRTTIQLTQAQADGWESLDSYCLCVKRMATDGSDDMVGDAQIIKVSIRS